MNYTSQGRYLALPVADGAALTRMHLKAGEMEWLFDAQLTSPDKAEYWVHFDAAFCREQELSLCSESGVPEETWRDWVVCADDLPDGESIFTEPHRPLVHFTSSRGWINDPNGLVKKNGQYHMFYQLNPFGCRGYDKGWGHCVSDNLFDWQELPPALSADQKGYSISGSTLFDEQGKAGFGKGAWIMAYSSRMHERPDLGQQQNIAYSTDGKIFHKYQGNPVLCDFSGPDFRDPKVFWWDEKQYFVMLVTFGSQLRFYSSVDLKEWSLLSVVDDHAFNPEHWIYECPELLAYPLADGTQMWVLSFSWIQDRSVRFLFGRFDGVNFIPEENVPLQRADYGRDFYAAVAWDPYGEMRGRKLWIGWMCYWPYSSACPRQEGWLNLFTVPRSLHMDTRNGHPVLLQLPAEEIQELVTEEMPLPEVSLEAPFKRGFSEAFLLEGTLSGKGKQVEFEFSFDSGECLRLSLDRENGVLSADRSACNCYQIQEGYSEIQTMPLRAGDTDFLILVDRNCMELYFDGGEHCMSLLCHSQKHTGALTIKSEGSVVLREGKWKMLRAARRSLQEHTLM